MTEPTLESSAEMTRPASVVVERPQSALARGIQITEYQDTRVNPDPIVMEESEVLLEEFLSPRKLVCTFGYLFIINIIISDSSDIVLFLCQLFVAWEPPGSLI